MTQIDFGTALTYQTLKGDEAGWSHPAAGVFVAIRMIGAGGTWAGRPDPKTDLEKQAVRYGPDQNLLVFGTFVATWERCSRQLLSRGFRDLLCEKDTACDGSWRNGGRN